jgi:hypothetical protein
LGNSYNQDPSTTTNKEKIMTHKEKLKIYVKINENKKKIDDIRKMIDNNESSGLGYSNHELKAEQYR